MTALLQLASRIFVAIALLIAAIALIPLTIALVLDPTERADSRRLKATP